MLVTSNPKPLNLKLWTLHSRKLTWKPKKGPIKTTVLLKGGYMGFHVSLGECKPFTLNPNTNEGLCRSSSNLRAGTLIQQATPPRQLSHDLNFLKGVI